MSIPRGGRTQDSRYLKAGTARVYIHDRPADIEILDGSGDPIATTVDSATGYSATDTDITVTSGVGIEENHIICITGEKMLVTAVAVNDLTVVRGIDGTIARAISDDELVVVIGLGFQVTGALTATDYDAVVVGSDEGLATGMVARPQRGAGTTDERIYIRDVGGDTNAEIDFVRDINLNQSKSGSTYAYGAASVWIVVAQDFPDVWDEDLYGDQWYEIETMGGITITPERSIIETRSDQRGRADNFIDENSWNVAFDNPITDPELLGLLDPVLSTTSSNSEAVGTSLVAADGKKITGIMMLIVGQEDEQREAYTLYDAQNTESGDVAFAKEQRMTNRVYNAAADTRLAAAGVHWKPRGADC
jgi:hypothetical protein